MLDKRKSDSDGAKAVSKRGKPVNMKSRIWRKGVKIDRRRKPQCVAVRVGGKVRVIGQSAAAKWLGMSRCTLVAAVAGRKGIAAETVALVRREYPELFEEAK